jgi:transcriptional regulator with XRE-family HTH domain
VTIRALARDIGVSPSLISQIETGKSQPSVSTLYAISSALDLPLEDLFDADEFAEPATSAGVADTTGLRYFGTDRAKGVGPHVSPEDRELLTLDSRGDLATAGSRCRITMSTSCSSRTSRAAPPRQTAG